MTNELLNAFMGLASRLSPENLHCDGEISRTEARRRERIIRAEWRALEGKLGRKVSEDEVWGLFLSTPRGQR
jgi:hypothetical protein